MSERDHKKSSILGYKKLSENAVTPSKGSIDAAGYDLHSAHDETIPAFGQRLIKTDLQLELPEGCYGRIASRSSIAMNNLISVNAGVVDRDYRGNVGILLFNHANSDYTVKRGDRVAQLICEKILQPELEEKKQLSDTIRGEKGFGSSGK